ncbi:M24 family metallopeptidase [Natranaerobius trueperi]|nr:Xaa-Pro peptidase family protein [Natranaerobius trueperi]
MNNYKERINSLKEVIRQNNISLAIIPPSPNLRYLTGYNGHQDERFFGFFIPKDGEPFLIAPELAKPQTEIMPVSEKLFYKDGEDPYQIILSVLNDRELSSNKILVDNSLNASFLLPIQRIFIQSEFELADNILKELRICKDHEEIKALKDAGELTDKVLGEVLSQQNWIAKTERDLALSLEFKLRNCGMEGVSFAPIVACGSNGATPHHKCGDTTIKEGIPIVIDFGGVYHGYASDMTRTVVFGEPDEEVKKVYTIVKQANEEAKKIVRPGIEAEKIDIVARKVIEEAGYGENFIHRTGHGIGMETHEAPMIVEGNKRLLKPGMTFSIEPGIYLPGKFGVRLEDIVVVTKNGIDSINNYPKELIQPI